MKNYLTAFLITLCVKIFAQYSLPVWSIGNANLTPKKSLEINTTFTSRYNTGSLQFGSQIFLFPFAPNFQVKVLWWDKSRPTKKARFYSAWKWKITSVHTFVIPSLLFKLSRDSGLLRLPYNNLPLNLTMHNEIILTFPLVKKYYDNCYVRFISLKFGHRYTFNTADLPLTEKPFWFLQTFSFSQKQFFYLGANYDTKLLNNLNFSTNFKLYGLPKYGYALENTALIYFGFGLKKNSTIAFGFDAGYVTFRKKFFFLPVFNIMIKGKVFKKKKSDVYKYLEIF